MRAVIAPTLFVLLLLLVSPVSAAGLLETVGDVGQVVLPAAALWTALQDDGEEEGVAVVRAVLVCQATTLTLKKSIEARRPDGGDGSFPSGHTAAAFVGAALLSKHVDSELALGAFSLATLVGVSRIEAQRHWPVDVMAGAVLGLLVGSTQWRPYTRDGYVGVSLSF